MKSAQKSPQKSAQKSPQKSPQSPSKPIALNHRTLLTLISVAMLAAIAYVLGLFSVATPLTPSYLKLDLGDVPALFAAMIFGAPWGPVVSLIKNGLGLMKSSTMGVGELSNFILSAAFSFAAGLCFRKFRTRRGAILSSILGAVAAAVVSFPSNFFLVYPFYVKFVGFPLPAILGGYQAILPPIDALWKALLVFNVPFTCVKFLLCTVVLAAIYVPLKPVLDKLNQ